MMDGTSDVDFFLKKKKKDFKWNVSRLKYSIYLYSHDSLLQIKSPCYVLEGRFSGRPQNLSLERKTMKIRIKVVAISTKAGGNL